MYANTITNMTATEAIDSQPTKLPEVTSALEQIRMQLDWLESATVKLEERISPILAQREVAGSAQQNQPEPVRVPLAGQLHEYLQRLNHITRKLDSALERVEL